MSEGCPRCTFNDEGTQLVEVPSNTQNIVIPQQVTSIFGADSTHYALYKNAAYLTSFSFESGTKLTTIQNFAFYRCSKLTLIDLSECFNLETIGDYAFAYCSSVNEVKLPQNSKLSTIQQRAFLQLNISTITFPNTIKNLGEMCLGDNPSLVDVLFQENSIIKWSRSNDHSTIH